MRSIRKFLSVKELLVLVGKDWRETLRSLVEDRLITNFQEGVEIEVDADKSLHLQAAFEMKSVQALPTQPVRLKSKAEEN